MLATVALTKGHPKRLAYGLASAAAVMALIALSWGGYTFATGPNVSLDDAEPVAIAIILDNAPTSAWKTPEDDRIARMKEIAAWMITRLPMSSQIAVLDRSAQPAAFSLDVASALAKTQQLRPSPGGATDRVTD